jgi:hypothetical protein
MRVLALLAALALPTGAFAQVVGPKQLCVPATLKTTGSPTLLSSTMASTRTFELEQPEGTGGFDVLRLSFKLVDSNTSITRFDTTCTVSDDDNTTDQTPQECTVTTGTATCVNSGVWQKASPGTLNWPYKLNISTFNDVECTLSVGAGAGAAGDTIIVTGKWCTL